MKKLFHITSSFPGETQQTLALRIGDKHCCFAITDVPVRKLYQLAYYSTEEMNETALINLFVNHPELNGLFLNVLVSYAHPKNLLVPNEYYNSEDSSQILQTMYGVNNKEIMITDMLAEWQLHNLYGVPGEVNNWLRNKFPGHKPFHDHTISIKNLTASGNHGIIRIDFKNEDFTLVATKESKLLLAETFIYSTPDDVIYYLLKVIQQYSLSQKNVKLILSGLIEQDSALYKELYSYFLNLEFKDSDWEIMDNSEYPSHFFTSLNDLAKCAL